MRNVFLCAAVALFANDVFGQTNQRTEQSGGVEANLSPRGCYGPPSKCAVYPVQMVSGGIVHMCDLYNPTCNDYAGWDWGTFTEELYGYDCPTDLNCQPYVPLKSEGENPETPRKVDHGALLKKVPMKRLPFGLNPNIRHIRSFYYSFEPDLVPGEGSEPLIYFRVMELLYTDPDKIENTRSLTVAWEMETPDSTIHVTRIADKVQPISAQQPHLFQLKHHLLNLLAVRAIAAKPTIAKPREANVVQ